VNNFPVIAQCDRGNGAVFGVIAAMVIVMAVIAFTLHRNSRFSFRARKTLWQGDIHTHGFLPAARPKALTSISRAIRRWALHHHSDKSLQDLAKMYNPYIEGWINYYGHFYRTHLRPTLKRIDAYVIRWARRKFKRLRHKTKGARDWFERLRRANPTLFAHWQLCHGNGRTSGAV
jgi:hypothetical protein